MTTVAYKTTGNYKYRIKKIRKIDALRKKKKLKAV
jgi:hypothetical protein